MTVADLIKKLSRKNPNAQVFIDYNSNFIDGYYTVTSLEKWERGIVIQTNHKRRLDVEDMCEEE